MSNLANIDFSTLDITGKNYLSWVLDAEIHLDAKGLGDTIKEANNASKQNKAKAMIFLRHHLHEGLKNEYLTIKDPLTLWNNLKDRYDHQKTVILPKARHDWLRLRVQDFKTVSEYNSTIFKITSQMRLCGENVTGDDMLEKTLSTFHAKSFLLSQQYREKGFKKYSELISCLLVAEQNNELLMINHGLHPTGTAPFPEVNVATHNHNSYEQTRGRGRGRDRGRGRGRGHNRGHGYGYGGGRGYGHGGHGRGGYSKYTFSHQKWKNGENTDKGKGAQISKHGEEKCHRCGGKGHWSRVCRAPEHLVKLYQESLKKKGKVIETNFAFEEGDYDYGKMDVTHLDVGDFFTNPDGKIDHLIGDGTVEK